MKINQVNDNQLQIIITKADLFKRNMHLLFRDILIEAHQRFGFEVVNNTSLMVEAYPLSEESMILTITKVSDMDFGFGDFMEDDLFDDPWTTFSFETLDDCLALCQIVSGHYSGQSALYKYEDKYYLYIDDVDKVPEECRGHFMEYSQQSQLSLAFLQEHAQEMIADRAIEKLAAI
jgi:adapter protein MecA 1/2